MHTSNNIQYVIEREEREKKKKQRGARVQKKRAQIKCSEKRTKLHVATW
jgi:hypothetical protein